MGVWLGPPRTSEKIPGSQRPPSFKPRSHEFRFQGFGSPSDDAYCDESHKLFYALPLLHAIAISFYLAFRPSCLRLPTVRLLFQLPVLHMASMRFFLSDHRCSVYRPTLQAQLVSSWHSKRLELGLV